ncbi:CBS domain-containing protein [Desulfosoma caldarium]|uniref:Acetoin utilization protein AcuB n=1 Tax=Desulfosoma caldarium TaxID=610254 RepID=A0A3N1VFE9_9BACT|nr:CBS domain-containing protein [Desulfosoma caldarium]ROR01586.1 acetoin utilization protein AcuB [Desulfosoma caldarium]
MYVGWHMKTNLVTVSPDTPVLKAREIMNTKKISHLPVTDGKARLLGIVTDRDLKEAWASPASTLSVYELTYVLQKLKVEAIMTKKVLTATPDMTIERAASILHAHRIGALPVIQNDKVVGIITSTDLMEVLLQALGMSEDSGRMFIIAKDRIGILAEVGRAMQEAGINIRSVMTLPLKGFEDFWQLIVRVNQASLEKAAQILGDRGFKVITKYVEDLTPYLP